MVAIMMMSYLSFFPCFHMTVGHLSFSFCIADLLLAKLMRFCCYFDFLQQEQGRTSISKETRCHDHLFAILCIFSGIFLVNYVLVNSAANVFYSTDLLLTFQDVLSLMDQV